MGLNMQYAWGDYGFKESTLIANVLEQSSTSSGLCTARGGTEMPKHVLVREDCTLEVQTGGGVSLSGTGVSVKWEKKIGQRCTCKKKRGSSGELGCDLSWETACKQY